MKTQSTTWSTGPNLTGGSFNRIPAILKQLTCLLTGMFMLATAAFAQSSASENQSPRTKRILIVLSAADTWIRKDGTKYPTGYWAEEFVVIHEKFKNAGYTVDMATPGGKKPTADPHSIDPKVVGDKAPIFTKYLADISDNLSHPLSLSNVNINNYDAVVVPGGHGPVIDLYKDKDMGRLLFAANKSDKVIGTVCHGQASLLSAVDDKGKWLFKGRKLTAFSDEEEVEFGTAANAPWLLASRLRECGAVYERGAKNWGEFIVRDGKLISGQNPASSGPMADAVLEAVK